LSQVRCTRCGTVGYSKRVTPGYFGVECVLWLAFLLPGIVYSVWRISARHDACATCGSREIIPAVAPIAAAPKFCASCGAPRAPGPFCIQCGTRL